MIRWDDATMLVAWQSFLLESPKDWDGLHGAYGSFGLDDEFLFACCGCPVLLDYDAQTWTREFGNFLKIRTRYSVDTAIK